MLSLKTDQQAWTLLSNMRLSHGWIMVCDDPGECKKTLEKPQNTKTSDVIGGEKRLCAFLVGVVLPVQKKTNASVQEVNVVCRQKQKYQTLKPASYTREKLLPA